MVDLSGCARCLRWFAPGNDLGGPEGGGESMPLKAIASKIPEKYLPWVENGFWILVFAAAYVAMQKVMHPGWKLFGI